MIHSGSMHFGNMIAQYYNKLAVGLNKHWKAEIPGNDLDFLPTDSSEGKDNIEDMNYALAYAKENRRRIMSRFMEASSLILW